MQSNRIFLIGFMGVGKTTLGEKLANKIGIPFIDIDQEIENKFEISINEYFSKYGETAFRKEETKMLECVINKNDHVIISVGGGLPCFNENIERMNTAGKTCYLHLAPKEIFQRLVNNKAERPLIKNLNDNELLSFIEDKLLEREFYYNQAQFKVLSDNQNAKQLMKILN